MGRDGTAALVEGHPVDADVALAKIGSCLRAVRQSLVGETVSRERHEGAAAAARRADPAGARPYGYQLTSARARTERRPRTRDPSHEAHTELMICVSSAQAHMCRSVLLGHADKSSFSRAVLFLLTWTSEYVRPWS